MTSDSRVDFTQVIRALLIVVTLIEGVILTILVIVLFLTSARVDRQSEITSCQSRYITALASALQARAVIGDHATRVTGALQAAVSKDAAGGPALIRAYVAYRVAENALAADRAAHPIPPAANCGA